nr:MAG TPA: hypothetical protein [Caudoviricetes sp.]DAN63511.1 MAG TPA: hypothetical protein [Caudoviricetes sp.]DAX26884.1 MAG TPA: hypothetical protein [Caudoviricetes sp.]
MHNYTLFIFCFIIIFWTLSQLCFFIWHSKHNFMRFSGLLFVLFLSIWCICNWLVPQHSWQY